MDIIRRADVESLVNGGVISEQLLFPENSKSERVTITRVTFAPGAKSPRHRHAASEQVWVALRGSGTPLLADSATAPFSEGDVVRFADGEIHGFEKQAPTAAERHVLEAQQARHATLSSSACMSASLRPK